MKKTLLSLMFATAASLAGASVAYADFCYGPQLAGWGVQSHCTEHFSWGYSIGGGSKSTTTAVVRANLLTSAAGGPSDAAIAYGFFADGRLAGTVQCYGGPNGSATYNAPGCVQCAVTDTNPNGADAVSPSGATCQFAVTHQVYIQR
jgi:hypothetical protein